MTNSISIKIIDLGWPWAAASSIFWNFVILCVFPTQQQLKEWRQTSIFSDGIVAHWKYFSTMYRKRWYCLAVLREGRFSELHPIPRLSRAYLCVSYAFLYPWSSDDQIYWNYTSIQNNVNNNYHQYRLYSSGIGSNNKKLSYCCDSRSYCMRKYCDEQRFTKFRYRKLLI